MTGVWKHRLSSLLVVIGLAAVLAACDRGGEVKTVDFSKTISVARPGDAVDRKPPLTVAVAAMISPKETFTYYRQMLDYLSRALDLDVRLIQRKTYGEIDDLFLKGRIDLGFVCSGPYAVGKDKAGFDLLAAPEIRGRATYQAYLVVNKDSPVKRLEDLRGRIFAFTDPESNTGHLVPLAWLAGLNERPETFFSRTIYTYSHDNSILAVSRGLVDGAAVDGLIWEYYSRKNPSLTARTRVIKRSEPFGIPPVVVSRSMPAELRERIQDVILSMHKSSDGQKILAELMIDRFVIAHDEWYDSIRRMRARLDGSLQKSEE